MKKTIILLALVAFVFVACEKGKESSSVDLYGRWKLTEQLADPGDGSGKWEKVTANQYVKFNGDGTIESNSILKDLRFSITDSVTISVTSKSNFANAVRWRYKITGKKLELKPPCIEACGYRLVKQ